MGLTYIKRRKEGTLTFVKSSIANFGEIGTLPTTYLGMPLEANSKSIEIWNSVIEKCD